MTDKKLTLIIGNKRYSSWSMRPWIALKVAGIEFEETLSPFDWDTMNEHFWAFSPTRKVPVLIHGEQTVWDSLAILETLHELFGDAGLWPADPRARAHARAVANEMHGGFTALREQCPMNMARVPGAIDHTADLDADIKRIETLFADCLERYAGPFLFGAFGIADAMYAPVINRFEVYELSDAPAVAQYSAAIKALPAWQQWERDARAEPWVLDFVEV
ncbi:MAG: glutathione S-transferase N-terminal domain-containing protein [Gammaproteobacteria bacterium]